METTLTLDFNTTNVDDDDVFHDFAYIQHDDMNLFVVSSSSDYKVAIVDMASPDKTTSYVMLKDVPYTDRARSRQIEHVEGTDYVWIGEFVSTRTRFELATNFAMRARSIAFSLSHWIH